MIEEKQLENGCIVADRYVIVKRIGGGGMGSVYLVRDKRLADAPRALKEMIGQFADEKQRKKAIEDFERESKLLASLEHPSIPTIFDYFSANGRCYLVMKYINGGDLEGQMRAAPDGWLPERTVAEWGIQLCDVLDYLHNQEPPIIYRDMKPANIMLDEKTHRVMLVDFGIARFVAPTQKNVTAIGTMGYAPPELFAGKVEPRSDLYSLGATMFHLVTGTDPQTNPLLLFDFTRYPRPRQINPQISEKMDQILGKAVEHRPTNRFASAAEMKKALEQLLRSERERVEPAKPDELGAALTIQIPNKTGISFPLMKESILLGRHDPVRGILPDIDLSPYDSSGKISRRHAMVTWAGGEFRIEDLGSANGSVLNGTRLQPHQAQRLQEGDQLCLGETTLIYTLARSR
ncbi:MAG: FHA domain-containing serine/threonine-protein kinase [Acidobacteriota bacterium]